MGKFIKTKSYFRDISEISVIGCDVVDIISPVKRRISLFSIVRWIWLGIKFWRSSHDKDFPLYLMSDISKYLDEGRCRIDSFYQEYFDLSEIVGTDKTIHLLPNYKVYVSNDKRLTIFRNDVVKITFLNGKTEDYIFDNSLVANAFFDAICEKCNESENNVIQIEGALFKLKKQK